jgi:hypothetical protein
VDYADYCRQIEAYLCQKNGGHLIRIVGPAFERVRGWADQGVPIKVAFGGIDRFCERHESKTGRRRPVRIEFCEPDILALFDDWRRSVGVAHAAAHETTEQTSRKASLGAHVERVIARLVARRTAHSPSFEQYVAHLMTSLDQIASSSRQARGAARAAIVDRLAILDREMMDAASAEVDAASRAEFAAEADAELAPFQSRMPAEARTQARAAAIQRLVRESFGLPVIRYDA